MLDMVRLLFHQLLDLPLKERDEFFQEQLVEGVVRAELESLLNSDLAKTAGLTDCVADVAGTLLRSVNGWQPQYCGPYRLVRLLGAGGMGEVYLGERSDGEIQQQVAVKLIRTDSQGAAWQAHFLKERQILASVNHQSIVRLLDAGHVDGRPYLVMEYVDGVPIDVYAANVEIRDLLKLFLEVCAGVAHAHCHLIVHRDLKPSNILVDTSGQPKLLDFGIAKLLDESDDRTMTREQLLTPLYASPEQLARVSQTTATDVYSLGAVLYKLLTGRSPHETGTQSASAMDVIRGAHHAPAPTRVNPKLPRDIDYVLRKALRTEAESRYVSVDAFAGDLRAILDSRPVQARSGDAWYRARKFLRRRWLPLAALLFALAGLTAGLLMANYQRSIAQRRFTEVRQLSNKLFDIDIQVRQLQGSSKVRQLIVDTSLEYLRRLSADVRNDFELALELGTAYMRVARVQGIGISPNLGQAENAERSLVKAQALVDSVLRAQPANRIAMLRAAQIAHDRMILAGDRRPSDGALPFAQKSAKYLQQYLGTGKIDEAEKQQVVIAYMNVANRFILSGKIDEGMAMCRRTIEISRSTNQLSQAGAAMMVLGVAQRNKGDLEEALKSMHGSAKALEPADGGTSYGLLTTWALALIREAAVLGDKQGISLGRWQEARPLLERALKVLEKIADRDPNDAHSREEISSAGFLLGEILRDTDPRQANEIYERIATYEREVKNNTKARRYEARALAESTYSLRLAGRSEEAGRRLEASLECLRQAKVYPPKAIDPGSELDHSLRAMADYEANNRRMQRALDICQQLLAGLAASKPAPETVLADATGMSGVFELVSNVNRKANRVGVATEFDRQRLDLWRKWDARLPRNSFVLRELAAAQADAAKFSANLSRHSRITP